jgi:DUF177 domain-containing protein
MPAFVLDLAGLRQGFTRVHLDGRPSDLDLEGPAWFAPLRVDLECDLTGDQLSVRGAVVTEARFECARCLAPFERGIEGAFGLFSDRQGSSRSRDEAELEDGDQMTFHDGRQLDLRGAARESLLLEWPMVPLCRDDCRGLCPKCGADLNQGPCGCGPS